MRIKDLSMYLRYHQEAVPRVHGNGMIQVDVPSHPGLRYNFWGHPEIPCQKVDTSCHDHSFGFVSEVIKGELTHAWIYYSPLEAGQVNSQPIGHPMVKEFKIYHPRLREPDDPIAEDTILENSGQICNLKLGRAKSLGVGQSYHLLPSEVHIIRPTRPSITLMRKFKFPNPFGGCEDRRPRVFVPPDDEPDNEFCRDQFDPDFLWRIIHSICKS
jgi:hypothetical protein